MFNVKAVATLITRKCKLMLAKNINRQGFYHVFKITMDCFLINKCINIIYINFMDVDFNFILNLFYVIILPVF